SARHGRKLRGQRRRANVRHERELPHDAAGAGYHGNDADAGAARGDRLRRGRRRAVRLRPRHVSDVFPAGARPGGQRRVDYRGVGFKSCHPTATGLESYPTESTMRIAYITAGAAGMYCGSCMHDNTLASALMALGHEALLIPTYTPIRTDEEDVSLK